MIAELGTFSLIIALWFSLLLALNVRQPIPSFVLSQFFFLALAMLFLIVCFINNDYTVLYVRQHSDLDLPLFYKMGAAWSAHEGSLLLWCLILSGWSFVFALTHRSTRFRHSPIILAVLGFINFGFILFLLATSNPFSRNFPIQIITGENLTPVLQDPGLIFHPPMLYLGYVGFAIPFAFAISALCLKEANSTWTRMCRHWLILPWAFLSCGIVLGSWWAYRELGWGGWWFWDPVENASLLPWLSATALLHSLIVTEKRHTFKAWTIFLCILTFALSLIGTFLVRSGLLVSVHAFASDPMRGIFLFYYLSFILVGSLWLFGKRIKYFSSSSQNVTRSENSILNTSQNAHRLDDNISHLSQTKIFLNKCLLIIHRENLLRMNTILLISAVITILLGTLYPTIFSSFSLKKIAIGESYFNWVFTPIALLLLLIMTIAPHIPWSRTHGPEHYFSILKKMLTVVLVCTALALLTLYIADFPFYGLTILALTLSYWLFLSTLIYVLSSKNTWQLKNWSMILAHFGIAILAIGITINKSYSQEKQIKIHPGKSTQLFGYNFKLDHVAENAGVNFRSIAATFDIERSTIERSTIDNTTIKPNKMLVTAELRLYSHEQWLSKTGISYNLWRDLYIALGNRLANGDWLIRIYYKPMVRWIWAGGFLLLIGGLLSVWGFSDDKSNNIFKQVKE